MVTPVVGPVLTGVPVTVSPGADTTYTLTVTNAAGDSTTATTYTLTVTSTGGESASADLTITVNPVVPTAPGTSGEVLVAGGEGARVAVTSWLRSLAYNLLSMWRRKVPPRRDEGITTWARAMSSLLQALLSDPASVATPV